MVFSNELGHVVGEIIIMKRMAFSNHVTFMTGPMRKRFGQSLLHAFGPRARKKHGHFDETCHGTEIICFRYAQTDVILIPHGKAQKIGFKIIVINRMFGKKILAAHPPSFRYEMSRLSPIGF
jgi:hypothetical protein